MELSTHGSPEVKNVSRSEDSMADGGTTTTDDIFNRVSDIEERSYQERFRDGLDDYVIDPATIVLSDFRGVLGLTIIVGVLLMGTVGVYVTPRPTTMDNPTFVSPFQSWEYPLGTGRLGQEIHRQIIHATPAMLKMVFAGAFVSVALGTVIGTVAGYKSGRLDYYLMMISDIFLAIPALVLVIVLAATLRPSNPYIIGFILGINFWPGLARTVRSEVLSLREENAIEAARVMGLSDAYIVRKYVIKNLMPYITVNAANSSRLVIFESVALYFIGVLPHSSDNWGVMMDQAYRGSSLTDLGQLHWLIVPMLMIVIFTLGIIMLAQAMDRLFNVKLMARQKSDDESGEGMTVNM